MGVFDFLPFILENSMKDTSEENNISPIKTYIDGAERAAGIITEGIDRGDISGISYELGLLNNALGGREQFVFEPYKNSGTKVTIIISIILSVAFLFFIRIFLWMTKYSKQLNVDGATGLTVSVAVIVINILLILRALSESRYMKRYEKYYKVLKYKKTELIDDLAENVSLSHKMVCNDLKKAIKYNLIPHGHFVKDNSVFMVSNAAYDEYMSKKAEYDRYYDKLLDDRKRMRERTPEIEDLMQRGREYIAAIHEINDIIKDKSISDKLNRMEDVVATIFQEVDINPSQAQNLGMFMDYYLPTTKKLLETYVDMDTKKVKGENIRKTQAEIVGALDTINESFETLLERFYDEKEMDISSDIAVMGTMMKQEGL